MCDTCGCNVTPAADEHAVEVLKGLLEANDHEALHNREHFERHSVLAINLMSSPGAGKTALLEATIKTLNSDLKIAVVEGDLETENDAERIRAKGVPAIQISTGSACHLDAHMVHHALHDLERVEVVRDEARGGDDKPAKYPVMFRAADLILVTKSDLLEVLDDFDPDAVERRVRELANPAPLFKVSAKTGLGMDGWLDWIRREAGSRR